MGDVINIEEAKNKHRQDQKEKIITTLASLAAQIQADEIIGVTFAAITSSRDKLWICALQMPGCGFHEMVGAANVLAEQVNATSRPTQ